MDDFFHELGRSVRRDWQARNFAPASFPEIAQSILEKRPPGKHTSLAAFTEHFLSDDEQPAQTHSGFGQPELIVFDDPRFYIQILVWLDGTTDIHQHTFSGAFHVMEGSSIQSCFEFENAEPVSAHLQVGNLRLTETRLLERGATVPIRSGRAHIHSLFHLDTPSATVVIRTHNDPGTGPQFTYLPPHLAVDPFHADALTTRRKQLLDMLEQTGDERYASAVLQLVKTLDFERGFFVLQNGVAHLRNLGAWEKTWAAFERKHGRLAKFVVPTLDEIIRRDAMVEMRRSVTEAEHRFFLALLLNVSARADILALVSQRVPGSSPAKTILRWAAELCESSPFGTMLLDATFPDILDVEPELQADSFLAALAELLGEAPTKKSVRLPRASLAACRDAFRSSSWRALVG